LSVFSLSLFLYFPRTYYVVYLRAARLVIAQLPAVKELSLEIIETIFVPKAVAKQLVLLVALEAGLVTIQQITAVIQSITGNFSSRSRLIKQLQTQQQNALTQDDWMDMAERIDNIQGNDVWRSDPVSPLYEHDRISARIDEFVHLMRRNDIFELMFVVRGSIGRNKFGLLQEQLFSQALAGTKVLVETYHHVVCAALDFCCDGSVLPDEEPIPTEMRLAFFNETRHSYGRTALLLSGGAALGFYHVGVVRTLMENRLMPRVIGGSSAGSILCAMIGTRTDNECTNDLFEVRGTDAPGHSGRLALNFFRPIVADTETVVAANVGKPRSIFAEVYYNTAGAFHDAKRTLQGFMPIPVRHVTSFVYDILTGNRRPQDIFKNDTEHFRDCVRANVGNFTFQEAFDRTGRILNIVVTPNNPSDPPRLLNYLTAPHVMVWSAAVASSSLPGVFEATRLVLKEADGWERYESGGGQHFSDGSMEQDLPMQQLSEMFNVNHFIISQANPHAVMFASYNQKTSVWTSPITGFLNSVLTFLKDQARAWLSNMVACIGARRLAPGAERSIGTQFFTQEYEGRPSDISLIPWLGHRSLMSALFHVIYNPSEAEFREWIQAAEQETWKYIPAIKSHIAEEVTLDRCVQRLRKRVVRESWEKHRQVRNSTEAKMGDRVPSFYTSPSLVNVGGLSVSDQKASSEGAEAYTPQNIVNEIDLKSGWGGLGLRGNRSSGNLKRSGSDASGLYIDDEEPKSTTQDPGERTETTPKKPSSASLRKDQVRKRSDADTEEEQYVKTASMANFYYRRTGHHENPLLHNSKSDPTMDAAKSPSTEAASGEKQGLHERKKSKSHADMSTTMEALLGDESFEPLN
jgi:TAG lipase/steryl ester hydrolase/phospholipase A2/LPA acyltransferase